MAIPRSTSATTAAEAAEAMMPVPDALQYASAIRHLEDATEWLRQITERVNHMYLAIVALENELGAATRSLRLAREAVQGGNGVMP